MSTITSLSPADRQSFSRSLQDKPVRLRLANLKRDRARRFERSVESRAAEALGQQPHFCDRPTTVEFRCEHKRLTLHGCLPSYYLKQMAQEAVRQVADSTAMVVVNEIDVKSF